jgi:hypothetical protein
VPSGEFSTGYLFPFPDKNCYNFYLEREAATGCRGEMQSISSGKAGQRSRRSRQIKTAWTQF